MFAIEFETDLKEGIIKIPDEYKDLMNKHFKIILLTDDIADNNEKGNIDEFFSKYNIDLNNYKFNREEANER